MTITHRKQLPDLMRFLGLPLIAAEIGTAEGFNAQDLLRNGIEKLYAVDFWGHIPNVTGDGNFPVEFHNANYYTAIWKFYDYKRKVVMLKGKSAEMAHKIPDNSLGLLYIDCDHSFSGVMSDLNAYFGKVVKGGIVSLHDFENGAYGVKPAVQEFCRNKFEIHLLPEDKSEDAGCWFLKK